MYTIKLLLTEISVHMGNICSDIQGAWTSLRSVHTPGMSEQIFPRMDLDNKSILLRKCSITFTCKLAFGQLNLNRLIITQQRGRIFEYICILKNISIELNK